MGRSGSSAGSLRRSNQSWRTGLGGADGCADAVSGKAVATLPIKAMNSRLFTIASPWVAVTGSSLVGGTIFRLILLKGAGPSAANTKAAMPTSRTERATPSSRRDGARNPLPVRVHSANSFCLGRFRAWTIMGNGQTYLQRAEIGRRSGISVRNVGDDFAFVHRRGIRLEAEVHILCLV